MENNNNFTYESNQVINQALNLIAENRTGGSINIRGLGFQLSYASYSLLKELHSNSDKKIRLEGIEDIDKLEIGNNEFIQIKTSINPFNAGNFWDLGVLSNYYKVFKENRNAKYRFVYNSSISKGKLYDLSIGKITDEVIYYWKEKLAKDGTNTSNENIKEFLSKITFEKTSEAQLIENAKNILFKYFNINVNTEDQFIIAIFYNTFKWSKDRKIICFNDLQELIQNVKDSFSKHPTNKAVLNNYLSKVSFQPIRNNNDDSYFDGKAAEPYHIANGLPVDREKWERVIVDSVQKYKVTIVKASSGQGKSTLAWQASKKLNSIGYTIYKLNYCDFNEYVEEIFDFIQTRLRIGQIPIIVIDGLNNFVSKYQQLIQRINNIPIRILVTTREEDWYRYGLDASMFNLNVIDIKLDVDEAKDIYFKLKIREKVHNSIKNWEPVWEKVFDKGLLIEYVYLLTQGRMLEERLNEQIKILNKKDYSFVKFEILRIVSVADLLNIKIKTEKIVKFIKENDGFKSDCGELLKELEREYFLQFNQDYIEGLHPIRSQHLTKILHRFDKIETSLISLLKLINVEAVYDFFISASSYISDNQRDCFFEEASKIVISKGINEIVLALDGLMHNEPYKYWIENKVVFDDVFKTGCIDIFIAETLPFMKLNPIKNMKEIGGDKFPLVDILLEKLKSLTSYNIQGSNIYLFANYVVKNITKNVTIFDNYYGIGYLIKWLKQLKIQFPDIIKFDEKNLIDILKNKDIDESSELYDYFNNVLQEDYKKFITKDKQLIFSILKYKTGSLRIEEKHDDIYITYLLFESADKANELSVGRIKNVCKILPFYKKYCTDAVVLPYPTKEICETVSNNAKKRMPRKNIIDDFDVHINQIWSKSILYHYNASSVYEWQSIITKIREIAVDFIMKCTRYTEVLIEENISRYKSSLDLLIESMRIFGEIISEKKYYPNDSKKYYSEIRFKKECEKIDLWISHLKNFMNQIIDVFKPNGGNQNVVAISNLETVVQKLTEVQDAFDVINKGNYNYSITNSLTTKELQWYERLLRTILFYRNRLDNNKKQKVFNAKDAVQNWWRNSCKEKLSKIHAIINRFAEKTKYKTFLPKTILRDGCLNKLVIGIENIDKDNMISLLENLVDLGDTDIHFIIIVNIVNNIPRTGIRIQRELLQKVKRHIEGNESEEDETLNPLPVVIDRELIKSLDGVEYHENKIKPIYEILINILVCVWKLMEYKRALIAKIEIEELYLEEKSNEFRNAINKDMNLIKTELDSENYDHLEKFVNSCVNGEIIKTADEIAELISNIMMANSENVFEDSIQLDSKKN